MKKGILKLLLLSISLTSFSVHAVDIDQVLEATDSLNYEDQAELVLLTAVVKAIDVNLALDIVDQPNHIKIPLAVAAPWIGSFGTLVAGGIINTLVPNSISHSKEEYRVSNSKEKLKKLNNELGRYTTHSRNTPDRLISKKEYFSKKIDFYKDKITSLPKDAVAREHNYMRILSRWQLGLDMTESQLTKIPIAEVEAAKERRAKQFLQRDEIQKKLDIAKNELRLMQTKKGFFYKIGRSAYRLTATTIVIAAPVVGLLFLFDGFFIVSNSEKDMKRLKTEFEQDIELLIEKSNAIFPEDYDI